MRRQAPIVYLSTLLFLLVIMGGNTECADYIDYEGWYETQNYPLIMEPGYMAVTSFFSSLGFNFIQFRFVYFSCFFLITFSALRGLLPNYHLICFFYLFFSFISDTIQLRNTMAMALLLLAISSLASGKRFKFVVLIIVSMMFHYSFAIFFSLLFYKKIIGLMEKHPVILFSVSIMLCLAVLAGTSFPLLLNIISSTWGESKVQYFSARLLNVVFLLIPLSTYILVYKSRKMLLLLDLSIFRMNYVNIVYSLSVFFILLMPIIVFSYEFTRMIKSISIEVMVVVSMVFLYRREMKRLFSNSLWYKYKLFYIIFIMIWMIVGQYWQGYGELFDNNIIFEY